jgi:hypothetical protein
MRHLPAYKNGLLRLAGLSARVTLGRGKPDVGFDSFEYAEPVAVALVQSIWLGALLRNCVERQAAGIMC